MKLTKNNESLQIVLPVALCRAKGWKQGMELRAVIDKNGDIILKEK